MQRAHGALLAGAALLGAIALQGCANITGGACPAIDSAPPTAVSAVVLGATTGNELARGAYPITYRRTDGGGRCPGPTAPEPVIITIPTQRS